MYSALAIIISAIYFSPGVSSRTSNQQYYSRSLGTIFALIITILLLFVPKMPIMEKRKKAKRSTTAKIDAESTSSLPTTPPAPPRRYTFPSMSSNVDNSATRYSQVNSLQNSTHITSMDTILSRNVLSSSSSMNTINAEIRTRLSHASLAE